MINYTEKGWGLHIAIRKAGYKLKTNTNDEAYDLDGNQSPEIDVIVQAIIYDYDVVDVARAAAKARLIKQSQVAANTLTYDYPEFEMQTWAMQEREALAWQSNNAALTPSVDIIAAQRGIDRVIILPRILAHAEAKLNTASKLAGERQRLEDIIDNSTDLAVIEGINFVAPEV